VPLQPVTLRAAPRTIMIMTAVRTSLPPIDGTGSDTHTTHIINAVTTTDMTTNARRAVHVKRAGGIGSKTGFSSAATSAIVLPAAERRTAARLGQCSLGASTTADRAHARVRWRTCGPATTRLSDERGDSRSCAE